MGGGGENDDLVFWGLADKGGRPREEIANCTVLARSGRAQSIGTTPLHPPIALVMLSRASIPSQVALDAGAGRRFPGAGSAPAAKSATAPPLHPTDVPRASAQCFYTHIHPRSCSVTPRTRDRHFRPRRPRVKGPAVTFSFETGDANRRNQLCCTVWKAPCVQTSVPDHAECAGHA